MSRTALAIVITLVLAAGAALARLGEAAAQVTAPSDLSANARAQAPGFPRLMGMNIGAKHYERPDYQQSLARLDVVILGFYRGWGPMGYGADSTASMRRVAQTLKTLNPNLLLGQYTLLNEAGDDPADTASADLRAKLDGEGWWLRNAAGRKVQWTSAYGAWEVNFTRWARPDASGRRWPEWLAERNHAVFFRNIPEFDIVYLDNVMATPRVSADWDGDGRDDDPRSQSITTAFRSGQRAYWDRLRALQPGALLIGNADNDLLDPEWTGQLDGAFLEALMGKTWSIEYRKGWVAMMARYRAAIANTRAPRIVGFNVWGDPSDHRFFRYAYASCLLDDGYFSFTDATVGYSSVPWFAEYDYKLGQATSPPPAEPWSNGVWRRDFERGVVLVNPLPFTRVVQVESGLQPLPVEAANRSPAELLAGRIVLEPWDGIVLARSTPAQ